jgi:hypothetical protein
VLTELLAAEYLNIAEINHHLCNDNGKGKKGKSISVRGRGGT